LPEVAHCLHMEAAYDWDWFYVTATKKSVDTDLYVSPEVGAP
jgi:hypothetical protein